MREIVIISGKGGTGKTSITGALAHLAANKVICDLDVDAPDLHLLLQPAVERTEEFYSGFEAVIDSQKCELCGTCADLCRYGAVNRNGAGYVIDPRRCEGCKTCVVMCPAEAIDFPQKHCGQWFLSNTRFGPMAHAQLFPGEENSGRLVMVLKQQARQLAKAQGLDTILCDGAPGIGCPVISSLSGATLAVAVTEPTPSGRHDLERVGDLCGHFRMPLAVILNKYDLNANEAGRIETFCDAKGFPIVGRLPHDPVVTRAMIAGKVVTEWPESNLAEELDRTWRQIEQMAGNGR